MFCVYPLLEFLTAAANAASSCERVVFVCDIADADHKQWAALLKTTISDKSRDRS